MLEVIDSSPEVVDPPNARELPDGPLGLRFNDVTFGYTRSNPVLRGLDLTVAPGETVAIVGGAGSGKSTIAMLVPRFYDVHSGSLAIGGVDVRQLRLPQLRAAIGMVFEDSFLFSDTIAANIAYGRPDADRARIVAAAEAAEAAGFIAELPRGYDTLVGERGLTLSGGQRQRIALARALLTDPRIVLLDDATSAVDPRVEAEILATLRQLIHGRTTVLVAHRRSTLSLADRIAVLEHGRVADVGTFDELMARCALFRLLLGGPGEDAEGIDAGELTTAPVSSPVVDGVTTALWQPVAADPLLACVLVGMGITSLSMASAAVRPVGARLAGASMDHLEDAAEAALAAKDPMAARAAVRAVLDA